MGQITITIPLDEQNAGAVIREIRAYMDNAWKQKHPEPFEVKDTCEGGRRSLKVYMPLHDEDIVIGLYAFGPRSDNHA
ncbi:MAG: hypothetical protein HYW26_05770 [Candidatus Aenigmarchaeota archaeon]|nr:hypothetical protein [Candidatus Aenigmarchaeota archaeon]